LQNWGGIPHPKGMIAEEIPDVGSQNVKFRIDLEMKKLEVSLYLLQVLYIYIHMTILNKCIKYWHQYFSGFRDILIRWQL